MLQPKRLASTIVACNTVIAGVLIAPNAASATESVEQQDTLQQQVEISNKEIQSPEPPITRNNSVSVEGSQSNVPAEQQGITQEFIQQDVTQDFIQQDVTEEFTQQQVKQQPVQIQQTQNPGSAGTSRSSIEVAQNYEPEVVDLRTKNGGNDWSRLQQVDQTSQQVQQTEQVQQVQQQTQQTQQTVQTECGMQVSFQQQASIQQSVKIGQQECPPQEPETKRPPITPRSTPPLPGDEGDTPTPPGETHDTPPLPGDEGDTPPTPPGGSSKTIVPWIVGGFTAAALSSGSSEAPKPQPAPEAPAPVEKPQAKPAPVAQQRVLANTGADASMLMIAALLLTLSGYGVLRLRKQ